MDEAVFEIWIYVIFLIVFVVYFIPTVIAIVKSRRNAVPIVVLNILAGWTVLGWIAALVWSLVEDK